MPLQQSISVRPIERTDWQWISDWFTDETLDRELGPLDAEWLAYVLAETQGAQLVCLDHADEPVALIGCVWDPEGEEHGITDLAVNPHRRGEGIGRSALAAALAWEEHPPARQWVAFVDLENEPAKRFFAAIGWTHEGRDDDDMERFVLSGGAR